LDKGVKDDKCLECHEDKTKGKVVHPAVGMGCFSCHMVRGSGDATRIVLKNGRVATLCFSCHDDKQPAKVKGHVHPPNSSDCLKCHNPHVSDNEKLLLKPTTGGKDENLCLSCHTKGLDVPKDGSRHAALDMGCTTCHTMHKSGERGKQEFDFHLTKSTPTLCVDCHSLDDKKLVEAHQNQPLAGADCVQCHDPHQSKSPKLLQTYLHNPFEAKMCDSCHQPAKDGKVVLTQADSRALCITCHEEEGKKIDSAKVQHPGAQGECIACHDPHAGKSPRFMKTNAVSACLSCHSEQADMATKATALHDPAFNQRCSICHEAHGGNRPKLLRDDVDNLCLSCHGPDARALKAQDGNSESIFGKSVTLPAGYVAHTRRIDLVNGRIGHPVPAHPVTGVADPRDKNKQITCISCHDPHAGKTRKMLVSSDGSFKAMCEQCHQEFKKEQSN
jgi:predicted CXXCH cytochrome family protein